MIRRRDVRSHRELLRRKASIDDQVRAIKARLNDHDPEGACPCERCVADRVKLWGDPRPRPLRLEE